MENLRVLCVVDHQWKNINHEESLEVDRQWTRDLVGEQNDPLVVRLQESDELKQAAQAQKIHQQKSFEESTWKIALRASSFVAVWICDWVYVGEIILLKEELRTERIQPDWMM